MQRHNVLAVVYLATVLMGFIILPYGIPDDVKKLLVQFVVEMHKYVVTDS